MKSTSLLLLLLVLQLTAIAGDKYTIKPKGYVETINSNQPGTNHFSSMNKVGGSFRLKEFSSTEQKVIETDLVTFFIAKNKEDDITFHMNCAKQVRLRFVFADGKKKHTIRLSQPSPYFRMDKDLNLSKFRDGICTVSVFNEKNELIHTIEFEKTSL